MASAAKENREEKWIECVSKGEDNVHSSLLHTTQHMHYGECAAGSVAAVCKTLEVYACIDVRTFVHSFGDRM